MAPSRFVGVAAFVAMLLVSPSVQAQTQRQPSRRMLSEESTYKVEHSDEEGSMALGAGSSECAMDPESEECQMRVDLLQRDFERHVVSSKQGTSEEAKVDEKSSRARDKSLSNSTGTNYYLIEFDNGGKCVTAQSATTSGGYLEGESCDKDNELQQWTIAVESSRCLFCLYTNQNLCIDGNIDKIDPSAYVFLSSETLITSSSSIRRRGNAMYKIIGGSRRRSARRREMLSIIVTAPAPYTGWMINAKSGDLYCDANNYESGGTDANFRFWKDGDSNSMLDKSELSDLGCYKEAWEEW
jgi:hypothetical protein